MSDQLSVEVIINDFEKLKEMFNTNQESFIWDTFSNFNFNFNKTLNALLDKSDKNEIQNDENKTDKKKFNPMETLATLFKNKSSTNQSDYQRLD